MAPSTSRQAQGPSPSLPSFPQFRLLPPELQLRIWSLSLPSPRIVDIIAISINETLQERLPPSGTCSSSPDTATWVRTVTERVFSPLQAQPFSRLLHVSHDTRRLVLQHYSKIIGDIEDFAQREIQYKHPVVSGNRVELVFGRELPVANRSFALFDPKCDLLFLQDPASPGYQAPKVSSINILVRWLEPEVLSGVRKLAIPYYSWRKTRVARSLKVFMEFKALEELWISFLGGYKPDGNRVMWSEVLDVGEQGGHMGEAEVEVRRDVEDLKKEFPGWGVGLRVGFVKHKGSLLDVLK